MVALRHLPRSAYSYLDAVNGLFTKNCKHSIKQNARMSDSSTHTGKNGGRIAL